MSSSTKFDVTALIKEIYARPELWNRQHAKHHDGTLLKVLWKEVAKACKSETTIVQRKWKFLRDKFARALKRQSPTSKYSWGQFDSLWFLKDQFEPIKRVEADSDMENNKNPLPKESSNNLQQAVVPIEKEKHQDQNQRKTGATSTQNDVAIIPPDVLGNNTLALPRCATPVIRKDKGINATKGVRPVAMPQMLPQIEKERKVFAQEKRITKEEDDEDLYFFKSLMSHVKRFSPYDKMEYRIRVLKVTQDFMKTSPNNSPDDRPNSALSYVSTEFKKETTELEMPYN